MLMIFKQSNKEKFVRSIEKLSFITFVTCEEMIRKKLSYSNTYYSIYENSVFRQILTKNNGATGPC